MKRRSKPKLYFGIPEDLDLAARCRFYLSNTERTPPKEFIERLMLWLIDNTSPSRKLSGPEIAAMVDYYAAQTNSFKQAIEYLARHLPGQTIESITKHHTRCGSRAAQLVAPRSRVNHVHEEREKIFDYEELSGDEALQKIGELRKLIASERATEVYIRRKSPRHLPVVSGEEPIGDDIEAIAGVGSQMDKIR